MVLHDQTSSSSGFDTSSSSSRVRKHYSSFNYDTKNRTLLNYLNSRNWRPYNNCDVTQLARNHQPFLKRLNQMKKLPVHDGCVNTITWNKTGEYILSGSDDCYLCITKPMCLFDTSKDYTVLHKVETRHLGNIFGAQFIPNTGDTKIASCCSRGLVKVHDIYALDPFLNFNCHSSTVYEVVTVPDDDSIFLSCGEDKTVRLFDMRVHTTCAMADTCSHPALIRNSHAMTTLNLHPLNSNLMLIGRADGLGLVYDRRKLPDVTKFSREAAHAERLSGSDSLMSSFKYRHPLEGVVSQFQVPDISNRCRFTSLCYNKDGSQVLASYSGEYMYLFNHDTSSNIELIQTLPKKSTETMDDDNKHSASTDSGFSSSSQNSKTRTSRESRRRVGSPLISRIRVRGDWSDTGVNSVPHSRIRQSNTDAQTAFLEHIALSLRSRANDSSSGNDDNNEQHRQTIPIAEIIVGPINYDSSSNDSESSERRQSSSLAPNERQSVRDDDDSAKDDDEEEEEEEDNDDDEDDEEVDTVIDYDHSDNAMNLDDSTSEAGSGNEDNECDRMGDSESNLSSAGATRRPRISSKTRAKFKKTLDDLKDKLSQIPTYKPRVKYQGHRNSKTSIKKAIFWGDDYIMSGSDCGRIMVWEKESAKLIMAFQADERVVNCLAPNPHHYALASSGIDYDIKLWSTQSLLEGPLLVSDNVMKSIMENNEIMLEESKRTFSVPPHLFFRVLARLARY